MAHADTVKWHCIRPDCRWSMVATIALLGEPAPRCVCGELMQEVKTARANTYLDFLRAEPARQRTSIAEED